MDILPLQTNYDHKNLVNDPPFITNNPVHEKIGFYKKEFNDNGSDLFKSEYAKDQKDNNFITACVLGTLIAIITTAVFLYKKFKSSLKKIK